MYKTYSEYADRYRFPELLKSVVGAAPGALIAAGFLA